MQEATRLRYTYPALPEGLVARAIVRLHEFIDEQGGKKLQWASGAILTREGARALIRTEPQDQRVVITVTGAPDVCRQLAGLCQAEMRDIHEDISGLDPIEETQVNGAWIGTRTLEKDELKGVQTGIPTRDEGTISIDPTPANDAYSKHDARVDEVWKPTVFISYSKSDVRKRNRLESELKILRNEGLLGKYWHDRMIDPGDTWDPTIMRELSEADIIIVMVTAAALSTDYITKNEIPAAMKMHEDGHAIVVPVILEDSRWAKTRLRDLNAIPEKGKAVDTWRPQSAAWKSIADGLAKVCEKAVAKRPIRLSQMK